MYLKRKIDDFLHVWSRGKRLPLVLKGPRQVGKTESVRHFADGRYESIVEINFIEEPKYRKILDDGYGAQDIVNAISRINGSFRFPERRTLLFFDEVQKFPDITTSLKFFAQDGRFDVICSGSLLGIHYKEIESNSVGFKTDADMTSMDFEEFLWAKGYGDDFVGELLEAMSARKPIKNVTWDVARNLFMDYCTLGGMPDVVRGYIEGGGSFSGAYERQSQIVADYRGDVRKYVKGLDQARILNVFDHIPVQLAKENRKFQISKVAHGARFRDYRGCVEWLVDAGIVNPCYCLLLPELPLKGNYDETKYKLYMGDTGLLVSMLDEDAQEDLRANRNLGIYKGAIFENIVAEALVKAGQRLYYWRRDESPLEEEFFVRCGDSLVPVEVKAGNSRSKSLRELIDSPRYADIRWGIKFADANVGYSREVLTLPWFCAFLLPRMLKALRPQPESVCGSVSKEEADFVRKAIADQHVVDEEMWK
jgi:predicted AAA+ superfamily ATPase